MRISDWSSDVCSSALANGPRIRPRPVRETARVGCCRHCGRQWQEGPVLPPLRQSVGRHPIWGSEEHTSELQSLMRNSYAVFCLKKKKRHHNKTHQQTLMNETMDRKNTRIAPTE